MKPFTVASVWSLIPTNYTAKLIGDPHHRDKFESMAAKVGITLKDDDFSTMIVEETPFDANGGIYVSGSFANHSRVEYKDAMFRPLRDGDKFTRLCHGDGWAVLVKGLVHIVDDDKMDADIILGEDCIKFFANDDLVQDSRYDMIVSDVAADYIDESNRNVSTQIWAHYPSFWVEVIQRGIANQRIDELCLGTAPIERILDVLSFRQYDGTIRIDPVGEAVMNGLPITYEGNWGQHDNNWHKYLRQEIQSVIVGKMYGLGGKLVVCPEGVQVKEMVVDDDLPRWRYLNGLPRTSSKKVRTRLRL